MCINIFKKDREYSRFDLAILFLVIFIVVSFSSRVALFINTYSLMDSSILSILKIFSIGLFYDIVAGLYYIIPLSIYLILIPINLFNSKFHKIFMLVYFFFQVYGIVFNNFSEWFFWEEFGKRFNFIAVDYLVYTHEVIQNIIESYPLPTLLTVIFIISAGMMYIVHRFTDILEVSFSQYETFVDRLKQGLILLLLPIIFFNILDKQSLSVVSKNQFNNELAKNGFYSLFSAFRNNTLDYDEFYKTLDEKIVFQRLQQKLGFDAKTQATIVNNFDDTKEQKYNVVLIMVESLSAEYMGIYGNKNNLTPHLDELTKKSLFFDNLYATGTRTVRGMEAVTLSVPPTPGRGIIKRPDNHNTYSVGSIFAQKGYENKFIYAGHGYFDNMND
jgi:phosphoglycerol transferase MdoB-like AlkP superfamily enzyme